ncbi:hypothetical protein GQ600_4484 [Phytophthora cactorum]|nr:hypothetical protein GQ600_4484 [Phytophthora cactorum]
MPGATDPSSSLFLYPRSCCRETSREASWPLWSQGVYVPLQAVETIHRRCGSTAPQPLADEPTDQAKFEDESMEQLSITEMYDYLHSARMFSQVFATHPTEQLDSSKQHYSEMNDEEYAKSINPGRPIWSCGCTQLARMVVRPHASAVQVEKRLRVDSRAQDYYGKGRLPRVIFWTRELAAKSSREPTHYFSGTGRSRFVMNMKQQAVWQRPIGADGQKNEGQRSRYHSRLLNVSRSMDEAAIYAYISKHFEDVYTTWQEPKVPSN